MSECIIIGVDNSEFALNEDYSPSRWEAQRDIVNLLASVKTDGNPETTVGILSLAGKAPTIVVTPTQDQGKILNSVHEMQLEGKINLATGIQIAQLALKHREKQHQRQRIILFVGSPVSESKEALVKIAKKLKKNNVAVDLVLFGSEDQSHEDLRAFHQAADNGNSALLQVNPGQHLDDSVIASSIVQGEGASNLNEFGVDPNLDPEMAMVLQMSAQEAEAAAARVGVATEGGGDAMEVDEETLLQRALEMSRQDDQSRQGADGGGTSGAQAQPQPQAQGAGMFDAEDADLQMAMQMSLMEATEQAKKEDKSGKDGEGKDGEGQ